SLVFTDGRQATSLVVATHLRTDGTTVYIIDPPPDEDRDHKESPSGAKRTSERGYEIRNTEQFSRSTRLLSEAKLLSFGGSEEAAFGKLQQAGVSAEGFTGRPTREIATAESDIGVFIGIRQEVPTRGGLRVEVFQGLESAVKDAY